MYPDMRGDMRDGRVIRSYPNMYPQGDMNYDMARGDMRSMDYRGNDYRGGQMSDYRDYGDMHHGGMGRGGYEPVEFMGYCQGYYGTPQGDYGYGDMRGRRDYGYDYGYGDYGQNLTDEELKEWEHKLMSQLDDREKQMFHKDIIMQKAKAMGKPMEGFGEKELYVATLMVYTDYKQTIGQNVDLSVKIAYDWLADKDVAIRGAEKLAVYYDCIVEGND
jgi:hypothetical protein